MIHGSGIDIIEVQRIADAIQKWGDHFLKRVFTDEEITYSQKFHNSNERFAARFAAKEAVYKALGNQTQVGWKDIQIVNDPNGKPTCQLNLKNFKHQILISLSHTKNYAVANAIITS